MNSKSSQSEPRQPFYLSRSEHAHGSLSPMTQRRSFQSNGNSCPEGVTADFREGVFLIRRLSSSCALGGQWVLAERRTFFSWNLSCRFGSIAKQTCCLLFIGIVMQVVLEGDRLVRFEIVEFPGSVYYGDLCLVSIN
ncbi:hypothetical protein CEXT_581071 [Caerostris extrusa]|uniref:Uncharacterized protein n=1 Tax=Caerostris extrusa TaxID=172846 RepID=A0AAV4R2K3_CAEEX|nr:hypothetical protein CEXT_581071 [Caerostris extrusa]